MGSMFHISLRRGVSLVALAAALGVVSACNPSAQTAANAGPPPDALPPVSLAAPLLMAPAAQALPPATPPPIAHVASRRQGYAFADRAYAMSDAFSDAPPDYTYDYEGARPWVWRSRDDSERVVEPVPGGERVYYYEAGSDQPFFVQDPQYGYGFENGALVTVYDRSGRELADAEAAARAEWAGRYLVRARGLYEASRREHREAVAEQNWQAGRDDLAAQRRAWREAQQQDADWRDYHEQYYPAEQAHYEAERLQRLAWAAHVDAMYNDQARAQREWAEAQHGARSGPPPAGFAPGPGAPGVPYGGPSALGAGERDRQPAAQQAQQQSLAQQQALAAQRAQAFAQQQASQQAAQQQAAQQQAAARQAALGQAEAQRHAQLMAQQQQAAAQAQAAHVAQQQAAARQAALGQAEAQRHAQLMAQQQQAAAQAQVAHVAQQQVAARQAALGQAEAQRHAQLMAQQQQAAAQAQAAHVAQQQAAARQAALGQAEAQRHAQLMAQQQQAAAQAQAAHVAQQQAAARQAALGQAEAQRHAQLMAQQQQAAAQAQAAHVAQQQAVAAQAETKPAAAHAKHPPKPGEGNVATKQQ